MFGPASSVEAIDCFFSHFAGTPGAAAPAGDEPPARPANAAAPAYEPALPPEGIATPESAAAHEWLKREKARLEAYTRSQLARVQAERQEALSQHYINEQGLVLWAQELNRKEEFLSQQTRSLQQQAAELSQREAALLHQLEQRRQTQEELVAAQKASADARQQSEGLRGGPAAARASAALCRPLRPLAPAAPAAARSREARAISDRRRLAGRFQRPPPHVPRATPTNVGS
jgi:hypothetical protein